MDRPGLLRYTKGGRRQEELETAGFKVIAGAPTTLRVTGLMMMMMNNSTTFEALPLTKFWSKMNESYPSVADVHVRALLMFPSTHLCKQGFSAMSCMKTKCCA